MKISSFSAPELLESCCAQSKSDELIHAEPSNFQNSILATRLDFNVYCQAAYFLACALPLTTPARNC